MSIWIIFIVIGFILGCMLLSICLDPDFRDAFNLFKDD